MNGLCMVDNCIVQANGFVKGYPLTIAKKTKEISYYVLCLTLSPGQYQIFFRETLDSRRPWSV